MMIWISFNQGCIAVVIIRFHLYMASYELGDLLGKSKTFQKLLTHPFMASSA